MFPKKEKLLLKELKLNKPEICCRSISADGLPYIGKLKNFDNVYVNVGHSFVGFTTACISGKLIAKKIIKGDTYKD